MLFRRRYVGMVQKLQINRKPFGFRLDAELVKQLKVLAAKQELAVNVLLEEAIRDLLTKYQK
jgi:predicted HicB family RNase H-like nuclease